MIMQIPSAMGFILLGSRVHCFTFFFWIWIKVNIGSENHSGYDFPWSPIRVLPFVFGSNYHDHHHSDNVGNMGGSCYLWDLMLDTNVPYVDKYLKQ
jgi:sterol desaturase/sphingolipid hydroxylase (fatty acid hydroxylase superfamily)